MPKVSVVIPNYNGIKFIEPCLCDVQKQSIIEGLEVIVVDNGSEDGSKEVIMEKFPWVTLISLKKNYGFCKAVNLGIQRATADYVILLNNDTKAEPLFAEKLYDAIRKDEKIFSCSAKLIQEHDRTKLDDAGDFYCALGWGFARGKGKPVDSYNKETDIFACCAGAAIYRKSIFEEIGYFDEVHFAYLEDIDIGYRALIQGYRNRYIPEAVVYHVGSASSGSRYNEFKIKYSSRNNIYLIYKNMPFIQILINLPLLIPGFIAKNIFFARRNFGKEYIRGIWTGILLCKKNKKNKVRYKNKNFQNYLRIQLQLWINIGRRFLN